MKKSLSLFICILLTASLLVGCGKSTPLNVAGTTDKTLSSDTSSSGEIVEVDFSKTAADMFTERDEKTDYDESSAIKIQLNGSSATASDNSVKISDSTVTITKDATHIISGTLSNGMIIVDAPDTAKLQLVLKSVDITSESSAPLYIKEADKVFITLVGDNTLTSGKSFTAIDESNIDATVFSKQDLTFNGSGSLTVSSPAGHGIVGKDDLVFTGGSYIITSASHGIQANDSVRIKSIALSVDSGKDGIHVENSDDTSKGFIYIADGDIKLESEGDGISSGSYIQIEGGELDITAGGGSENGSKSSSDSFGQFGGGGGMHGGMFGGRSYSDTTTTDSDISTSMKGIKSGNSMLISKGTITVNSADDAIHSNISATINGGTFNLASGDDAIHAEDTLTVTNGKFNITECYEGLEALHINISGGDITLTADDDGLNAAGGTDSSGTTGGRDGMFGGGMGGHTGGMSSNSNGSIVISGGTIYIQQGGDGIDANGTLEITGGSITVSGANSGDTSILDFDATGTISGGTFIGTGSSNMTQNFSSSSTQGVIMVRASGASGTVIKLTDSNNNTILTHTANRDFSCIILSNQYIISGNTYTLAVGSSTTAITMSSTVYSSIGSSGGGGMGGKR